MIKRIKSSYSSRRGSQRISFRNKSFLTCLLTVYLVTLLLALATLMIYQRSLSKGILQLSSTYDIQRHHHHLSTSKDNIGHQRNSEHLKEQQNLTCTDSEITTRTVVRYLEGNKSYVATEAEPLAPCDVRETNDSKPPIYILVWNTKNMAWNVNVTSRSTTSCRDTSITTCIFTIERRHYNVSDAVIFYGDLMHQSAWPPTERRRCQKWIYLSHETPINTVNTGIKHLRIQRQRHLYNLTSTYSTRSDIPIPYFNGRCTVTDAALVDTEAKAELRRLIRQKTGVVAWFVSHCVTSSRRENYVRELSRYIKVDVYGRCGTLNCARRVRGPEDGENYYNECDEMVAKRYKFYLALENSLCVDYITEKFFRFLRRDVVAVALGAANYLNFVPNGTFIDVREFGSPEKLANFLRILDEDDSLYEEFLLRKRALRCQMQTDSHFEQICSHLDVRLGVVETTDLSRTLDPNKVCIPPARFFRGVADFIRF